MCEGRLETLVLIQRIDTYSLLFEVLLLSILLLLFSPAGCVMNESHKHFWYFKWSIIAYNVMSVSAVMH